MKIENDDHNSNYPPQNNDTHGDNNNGDKQSQNNNDGYQQNQPNNFNGNNNSNTSRKGKFIDVLLGIGASLIILTLMFLALYIGHTGVITLVECAIIAFSTFGAVRSMRRKRPIIGTFIIVTLIPSTLLLLLAGACAVMLGGL